MLVGGAFVVGVVGAGVAGTTGVGVDAACAAALVAA